MFTHEQSLHPAECAADHKEALGRLFGISQSSVLGSCVQPRVLQAAKNLGLLIGSPAPAHCGQPDCLSIHQAPFDWCGPLRGMICPGPRPAPLPINPAHLQGATLSFISSAMLSQA